VHEQSAEACATPQRGSPSVCRSSIVLLVADLNRLAQAMTPESFTDFVIRGFKRTKSLGEGAIAPCSAEQFFAPPAPGDNSVAVIVKHVAGNLVSRWTDLLTSDGEKPESESRCRIRDWAGGHQSVPATAMGAWLAHPFRVDWRVV
jgi:hypothetical protein